MTSQVTNRREGGSTSCPAVVGSSGPTLRKELKTVWVAPELLGAPTIGGGSARSRGGGGGGHRSQISLPSCSKYTKMAKTGDFLHILANKSPKTLCFAQKY
jgi:hypothetical protein